MDSTLRGVGDQRLEVTVERASGFEPELRADLRTLVIEQGLAIFGWVVDSGRTVDRVELSDGETLLTRVPLTVDRPDVVKALDLRVGATPGFNAVIEPRGVGRSQLHVHAVVGDRRILVGRVEVTAGPEPSGQDGSWQTLGWTVRLPPPESEKVLVGKNGWLYLVRDSNDVIGQQTGRVHLSEQARQDWKQLLVRRSAATGRLGVRWQTLVIPDKEIVYPEYLPDEIVPAPTRPVHEILDIADQVGAPVSYALDALQRAKASFSVYPRTDSHWNYRGSYVAYRLLCELMRAGCEVPVVEDDEIQWEEPSIEGGLGQKMHPPLSSPIAWAHLFRHRSKLAFDNQVINHGRVVIFEQDVDSGPTCLLFGESFAQHLVLFLKESFRRLVYVHTSMLVDEVIEAESPDVVVSLPVERFLIKVPDDGPGLAGLAAAAAQKAQRRALGPDMAFVAAVPRRAGAGGPEQVGRMPWGQPLPPLLCAEPSNPEAERDDHRRRANDE